METSRQFCLNGISNTQLSALGGVSVDPLPEPTHRPVWGQGGQDGPLVAGLGSVSQAGECSAGLHMKPFPSCTQIHVSEGRMRPDVDRL